MSETSRERIITARLRWGFADAPEASGDIVPLDAISAEGVFQVTDGRLKVSFTGDAGTYRIALNFPKPFVGNGATFKLKVSGWGMLEQVIVAYVHHEDWHQISMGHMWSKRWLEISMGQRDLTYRILQDRTDPGVGEISAAHLHFNGQPGPEGGVVELEYVELFNEVSEDFPLMLEGASTSFLEALEQPRLSERFSTPNQDLLDVILEHRTRHSRTIKEGVADFLQRGRVPLFRVLDWPYSQTLPPAYAEVNSYRWSWHALHPALSLLLHARETGDLASVFAARDFVSGWLERSYYGVDPDKHFTWYDHGVGDRVVAFVLLWEWAIKLRFDQRFTARLLEAIFRHCQLLATEAFYCFNQVWRHHNHGVYQDLGLLFGALAIPELSEQQTWLETAQARLVDQFEHVVVHDGELTITTENSIDYHRGLIQLVDHAQRLLTTAGRESRFAGVIEGMRRFSELASYVDGRNAAFGDGGRQPNPVAHVQLAAYAAGELHVLTTAGYAFAKGNHEQHPFMLSVVASATSATHKHQDHLSFSLFFDGVEWLIDPAYFSYDPAHSIANYLRSAVAHNALVLPDSSYSMAPGRALLSGEREAGEFRIQGRHQSYAPCDVERSIRGSFERLDLRFVDKIVPSRPDFEEPVVLMLHCGDGVAVRQIGRVLQLTHPASSYALAIALPDDRIEIVEAEVSDRRVRGVAGASFTQHIPIKTIGCEITPSREVSWNIVAERLPPQ